MQEVVWTTFLVEILLLVQRAGADMVEGEVLHGEFCQHQQFKARCQRNEIIVIERASYGRMRLGRCVATEFGYINCSVDVMQKLDVRCSGRQSCELSVTEPNFKDSGTPCNVDLTNYLEVTWKCVHVSALVSDSCMVTMPRHRSSGILPSILSRERPCGSDMMPWTIQVSPGQRINVTLLDFGPQFAKHGETDPSSICYRYGHIGEVETDTTVDVCAGTQRQTHVYTSLSNKVHIILNNNLIRGRESFVLIYQAVGCPNFDDTGDTWVRATDTNTLLVGCKHNDNIWDLECKDTQWTGVVGNCSQGANSLDNQAKGQAPHSRNLPPGLTIGVILGVAITISVCIVVIGLVCLRRIHRKRSSHRESILLKDNSTTTTATNSIVSERVYNPPSCYMEPEDSVLESLSRRDPYYSCRSDYSSGSFNHHRHPPIERQSCHYAPACCTRSTHSATAALDLVQTESLFHQRDCAGSRDCIPVSRDCQGSMILMETSQSEL